MSRSKKSRSLTKLIQNYDRDNEVSPGYIRTLHCSRKRFERFLGRPAKVRDLKAKNLNAWMQHELKHTDLADQSRANGLTNLITLWKYTKRKFDRKKIRKVKVRRRNPNAWNYDELKSVADSMLQLPGLLSNGVPRSLYFSAIVWFAYDTGLRRRDIWNFRFDHFTQRRAVLSQNKTNHLHVVQVTEATMEDLQKITDILEGAGDPDANTPLRWPQSQSQFYYWFKKARGMAGVDPETVNRVLQHLRRTGATAVEKSGGKAFEYLGHTAAGLDRLSYIDRGKTVEPICPTVNRPSPPSLRIV